LTTRTANLEVITQNISSTIAYTGLERTLIDITVRPAYAGGVHAVMQAFKNARGRISVGKLVNVLRNLNYTYPYNQAIGDYLREAGYTAREIEELKATDVRFNFYLAHGMKKRALDAEWRVYVPKYWTWLAPKLKSGRCRHVYARTGRGAVAVFDVRSNEELHAWLNERAEIIPAHFEVYPLIDAAKAKAYLGKRRR
jgi:hypothetical protein